MQTTNQRHIYYPLFVHTLPLVNIYYLVHEISVTKPLFIYYIKSVWRTGSVTKPPTPYNTNALYDDRWFNIVFKSLMMYSWKINLMFCREKNRLKANINIIYNEISISHVHCSATAAMMASRMCQVGKTLGLKYRMIKMKLINWLL